MSKKQDLKQDLKQLEEEVSKVYYHITNGIISKPYTISNDVIHVADEQIDKIVAEETNALQARAEKLEAMVERLIGLGSTLIDATSVAVHPKECEEWFDATDEWYGAQQ